MAAVQGRGGAIFSSAVVLGVAIGFGLFMGASRHAPSGADLMMHGRFSSANGLHAGADVSIAGVVVGRVQGIRLDPQDALAIVDFTIPRGLALPADTTLGIAAPGMTSGDVLTILPGHAHATLAAGATIDRTTDQVSLEQQVSDYIFSGGGLGQ